MKCRVCGSRGFQREQAPLMIDFDADGESDGTIAYMGEAEQGWKCQGCNMEVSPIAEPALSKALDEAASVFELPDTSRCSDRPLQFCLKHGEEHAAKLRDEKGR